MIDSPESCDKMGWIILFTVSLFTLFSNGLSENLPVFIWETGKINSENDFSLHSLGKVSSSEFAKYFKKKISAKPFTVLFLEENLSLEDFRNVGRNDQTIFGHLQNITSSSNVQFLPSVENPYKSLKKLGVKWQEYNDKLEEEDNFVIVKLSDASSIEDRSNFLKRHDTLISDIFSKLTAKYSNVLAVYTGLYSSWIEPEYQPLVRKIREVSENSTLWSYTNGGFGIIMYLREPPTYSDGKSIMPLSFISQNGDTRGGYMRFFLKTSDVSLTFRFNESTGSYWSLTQIEVDRNKNETILLEPSNGVDISAPFNFSYSCARQIIFSNSAKNIQLTFNGLQVQAYQTNDKILDSFFDDSYDCVPFFSGPIWSALFISLMLGFILVWGLMNLMDIKTMDQFDDPKGKTITISAVE